MPRFVIPALAICLLVPAPAHSQGNSGAVSLFINPSVRSSGMGQSGRALFGGGDPNSWLNPALLPHTQGLRVTSGRTQLVPDLADDVWFRTRQWSLGVWGLGIAAAPKLHLDYGLSIETQPGGSEPIGTFNSFEEIDSWGAGVNVVEFAENLGRLWGGPGPLASRYLDLSLGEMRKDVLVDLAPASTGSDGTAGIGDAATRDTGFLLRVTPGIRWTGHPRSRGSTPRSVPGSEAFVWTWPTGNRVRTRTPRSSRSWTKTRPTAS